MKDLISADINHEMLKRLVVKHYETKQPLHVYGSPGIGKSQAVKEVLKNHSTSKGWSFKEWDEMSDKEKESIIDCKDAKNIFVFADIRLSMADVSDLKGLPQLNNVTYTKWLPPLLIKVLSTPNINGVIFLDEINTVPQMLQATAYQLINDKQCGEVPLSKNVVCFSAGNQLDDHCGVQDESDAMKSRRCNYTLGIPTADEWIEQYALPREIDIRIIGYLRFEPSRIFEKENDRREASFPCPRTWEKLSILIKGEEDIELIKACAFGAVGAAVGTNFVKYVQLAHKINIDEILKKPELVKKYDFTKNMSELCAIAVGVAEKFRNKQAETIEPACQVAKLLSPELSIFLLKMLKTFAGDNVFLNIIPKSKTGIELINKHGDYLKG